MNFDSFWSLFDGAFAYLSNGANLINSFFDCLPLEVARFLVAMFVIPFGCMVIVFIIRILK